MARGPSGKLVVEVETSLKDALHARLAAQKTTMKQWFIEEAEEYLRGQQALPLMQSNYPVNEAPLLKVAEPAPTATVYKARRSK